MEFYLKHKPPIIKCLYVPHQSLVIQVLTNYVFFWLKIIKQWFLHVQSDNLVTSYSVMICTVMLVAFKMKQNIVLPSLDSEFLGVISQRKERW